MSRALQDCWACVRVHTRPSNGTSAYLHLLWSLRDNSRVCLSCPCAHECMRVCALGVLFCKHTVFICQVLMFSNIMISAQWHQHRRLNVELGLTTPLALSRADAGTLTSQTLLLPSQPATHPWRTLVFYTQDFPRRAEDVWPLELLRNLSSFVYLLLNHWVSARPATLC